MDELTKALVYILVFCVIFLIASIAAEILERCDEKRKECAYNRRRRGKVKRELEDDIKFRYVKIAQEYASDLKSNNIADALCAAAARIDEMRKPTK